MTGDWPECVLEVLFYIIAASWSNMVYSQDWQFPFNVNCIAYEIGLSLGNPTSVDCIDLSGLSQNFFQLCILRTTEGLKQKTR